MLVGTKEEIQRGVADQQREVRKRFEIVAGQRLEFRIQPALSEQDTQKVHAGQRSSIAKNFLRLLKRFAMREENAFHFAKRGNRRAVQDIITVVEKNLRDAHQRRI